MAPIQLSDGTTVTPFKPPTANFSLSKATDDQLLLHGFPARPTDPKLAKKFNAWINRLSGKLQWVSPEPSILEGKGRGVRHKSPAATVSTSDNWCGVQVTVPARESALWVAGTWVVPNVSHPTKKKDYYSCHWVGIDGNGPGQPLLQAGVECDVTGGDHRDFYAWYEWLPDDPSQVKIKNMPINPGDYVTAIVCSDNGAGSTTGTIYFSNNTLGIYTSFRVAAPNSTLLGQNIEWISEVTQINDVIDITTLADFGEVFFSDAIGASTGQGLMNIFQGQQIEMEDISGNEYGIGVAIATDFGRTLYFGPAGTK